MFFKNSVLLSISFALVACGGGGGSAGSNPQQPTLFTTAGEAVVIPSGSFRKYSISGGTPPYQATSANSLIATGFLDGNSLTVDARDGGKTDLRITDRNGGAVLVSVTVGSAVALHTSAPDDLTVGVGGEPIKFFIAGGSPPYTVTGANPVVAEIKQTDATHWTVLGKAIGDAGIVKIFDNAGGVKGISLKVASPALRIAPDKLTMPVDYEADIVVSGGQPPYFPAGGIPAAVQVTPASSADGKFKIKGALASTLDVSFSDSAGQSVKVAVEINVATIRFRMSPTPVFISELNNDLLTFSIFGFYGDALTGADSGQVCIYVSDPTYAGLDSSRTTCSIFSSSARTFSIGLGTSGSRCVSGGDKVINIRAVDSKQQVAEGALTIIDNGVGGVGCNSSATALAFSPTSSAGSKLEIPVGADVSVLIQGGTGNYAVSSNDTKKATVSVSGNIVTITGVGTAVVSEPKITVTDLGNGATGTIFIN